MICPTFGQRNRERFTAQDFWLPYEAAKRRMRGLPGAWWRCWRHAHWGRAWSLPSGSGTSIPASHLPYIICFTKPQPYLCQLFLSQSCNYNIIWPFRLVLIKSVLNSQSMTMLTLLVWSYNTVPYFLHSPRMGPKVVPKIPGLLSDS